MKRGERRGESVPSLKVSCDQICPVCSVWHLVSHGASCFLRASEVKCVPFVVKQCFAEWICQVLSDLSAVNSLE